MQQVRRAYYLLFSALFGVFTVTLLATHPPVQAGDQQSLSEWGERARAARRVELTRELDEMSMDWIATMGLSESMGRRRLADATVLYDFQVQFQDDPRFGAVWQVSEDRYEVYVRRLESSFDRNIDELAQVIEAEIVVVDGGASHEELMVAVDSLHAANAGVPYVLDRKVGVLFVVGGAKAVEGLVDPAIVVAMSRPEPATLDTESGADIQTYGGGTWTNTCTLGYMWGTSSNRGYVTTGHCYDTARLNPSGSLKLATLITEQCPNTHGSDVAVYRWTGTPNVGEWHYGPKWPGANWGTIPHRAPAGGFNPTQPTYKVGNSENTAAGTTGGGEMVDWSEWETAGSGDCGVGTTDGVLYTNSRASKDSGGPVFVYWGGHWLPAAMHQGVGGGTSRGEWIGWITPLLPPGAWICSDVAFC